METYSISEEWNNYKQFSDSQLADIDFLAIGYLYAAGNILFRCTDENILDKIKERYEVTVIDQLPEQEVTDTAMWRYFGNSSLFR